MILDFENAESESPIHLKQLGNVAFRFCMENSCKPFDHSGRHNCLVIMAASTSIGTLQTAERNL